MTTLPERFACPHCGNRDEETIEGNGCGWNDVNLTLLCRKPCAPHESTIDDEETRVCACQWDPNDR